MQKEKPNIELIPADEIGYIFTQEEKDIIARERCCDLRQNTQKLSNDSGKYVNPNFLEMPQLQISEREHKKVAHKTVGRVLEKLDKEHEK
ncbi:MAG: hypothetical protein J6J24_05000 [Clostridia bacterium]|nr:hypothetical protein [Clostridia bacterium]